MQGIGENGDPMDDRIICSYVEEEYTPGALVWGKVVGYPYWPAVIETDPNEGSHSKDLQTTPKFHAVFLGDPPSRAWLPMKFIRPFDMSPPIYRDRKVMNSKKYKIAVLEADSASRMNNEERLAKYSFSVQKRRKEQAKAKRGKKTCKIQRDESPDVQVDKCEERLQEEVAGDDHPVSHYVSSKSITVEYIPGSLVWAKLVGHPYWPAVVEDDPNSEIFLREKAAYKEYHVVFLDKPPSRAWISASFLRSFSESPPPEKKKQRLTAKKYKWAVEEAKKASKMAKRQRLACYSFVTWRKKSLEERRLRRTNKVQKTKAKPAEAKTATRQDKETIIFDIEAGMSGIRCEGEKHEKIEPAIETDGIAESHPWSLELPPEDIPLWCQKIMEKIADLSSGVSNKGRKSIGLEGSKTVMNTDVVNSSNSGETSEKKTNLIVDNSDSTVMHQSYSGTSSTNSEEHVLKKE